MFQIGQEVICINDGIITKTNNPKANHPNLIKGKTYVILGIKECECGAIKLDIGLKVNIVKGSEVCFKCLTKTTQFNIHWVASTRFIPIDYNKLKTVSFKKIVKKYPIGVN